MSPITTAYKESAATASAIGPARFSKVVRDVSEAMSIKYNTRVYDLVRRGRKVIVMSLGEAFFDLPLLPMDELPFPDLYHYSHSRGLPELRAVLCQYYARAHGVPIDPEREILVTAGSKAALYMALLSILDPGDEVLLPEPAWVSYVDQVKLCHGRAVGVPCERTVYDLERYITPRTRAIIVTTPNNPRGYIYTEEELTQVLRLAEEHNLWVLSDEAYSDFVLDGSFTSLARLDPEKRRSIVFNSVSKNLGISGWRIGYVVGAPALIDQILKVNQHLITCPATILCHYVTRYFDRLIEMARPQVRQVVERRELLADYMRQIGLEAAPGGATFYFFVSIEPSRLSSEEFADRLLSEDLVSVVPGVGYGESCDRYIRVSIGTADLNENKLGLRKIKALIDATT